MTPQVLTIIQREYYGEARARAIGAYSLILAVGVAAGQVAGGLLVSAHLLHGAWRPALLLNAPIGAALLVAARRGLPPMPATGRRTVDGGGVGLLALAMLMLVLPLTLGPKSGWPWWSVPCLAVGVVSATFFAVFGTHESARSPRPTVRPRAAARRRRCCRGARGPADHGGLRGLPAVLDACTSRTGWASQPFMPGSCSPCMPRASGRRASRGPERPSASAVPSRPSAHWSWRWRSSWSACWRRKAIGPPRPCRFCCWQGPATPAVSRHSPTGSPRRSHPGDRRPQRAAAHREPHRQRSRHGERPGYLPRCSAVRVGLCAGEDDPRPRGSTARHRSVRLVGHDGSADSRRAAWPMPIGMSRPDPV